MNDTLDAQHNQDFYTARLDSESGAALMGPPEGAGFDDFPPEDDLWPDFEKVAAVAQEEVEKQAAIQQASKKAAEATAAMSAALAGVGGPLATAAAQAAIAAGVKTSTKGGTSKTTKPTIQTSQTPALTSRQIPWWVWAGLAGAAVWFFTKD